MRTFLLTAVLLMGYILTAGAQTDSTILTDPRSMKFKPGPFFLNNPMNKGKLDVPFNTRNRLLTYSKGKAIQIGKPAQDKLMVQGGMPIFKPEGSFPMPIYKPDSTIHFTMRIKEYKRMATVDFK